MNDFLTNPTGKSSSSFARRDLIIADLNHRYDLLIKESNIEMKTFLDHGSYIFYLKIPSEKFTSKLYYDVVLEFIPISSKGNSGKKETTINNYMMRMFSNSPNFMFTYAYVYKKDNNLVKFLENKLSKKSLEEEPKVKNPQLVYGFEKSVFFALLHIKRDGMNFISKLVNSPKINKTSLSKVIMTSNKKLDECNKLLKEERDKKKAEKAKKSRETAMKRTTHKVSKEKSSNYTSRTSSNLIKKPKKSGFNIKKPIKSTVNNKKRK